MPRVLTRCPDRDRVVATGHHLSDSQLLAARARYGFRCSACAAIHWWERDAAWLERDSRS